MKRLFFMFLAIFAAIFLMAGCTAAPKESEAVCRAMYLPFGKQSYVLVNQENGNAFTVTMPEELYDLSGQKITPDELQKGNILEITGDGVMLETYPGQYPGVKKIRVVEEGNPRDGDQYQDIIDSIYVPADPSAPLEPPSLQVEYLNGMTASCALATTGGYQWNQVDDSGVGHSVIACGPHILNWNPITPLPMEEADRINLLFSQKPESVSAERWPQEQLGKNADTKGEAVEVQSEDGKWYIDAEPGYVYGIYGKWTEGNVEYGILTQKKG